MALRLVTAALALVFTLPVLAQRPVYPSFPPPPAPSGDSAPHPTGDAQQQPGQGDYPYQDPADDPGAPAPPAEQAPQKPSPYPQQQEPYPDPASAPPPPPQTSPAPGYPQSGYPPSGYPPPGTYVPTPPTSWLNWVPRGMEALSRTAAFHTDLTFDRIMLQMASGMWDGPADPATAMAINRLDGISVHVYHYAAPGMYDSRMLEGVRREYSSLGWQHLVATHSANREGATNLTRAGATDLWISFHHLQATGAVLLLQSANNVSLIAFSGNLSPLDLLHLRGRFGIPRFAGDRFVPAPGARAHGVAPPLPRY